MKKINIMGANIDNYIIPLEETKSYLKNRNYWRQYLLQYFKPYFNEVDSAFAGSQDGEAIVGYDKDNNLQFVFHLDPGNLAELDEAKKQQQLEQYLKEQLI